MRTVVAASCVSTDSNSLSHLLRLQWTNNHHKGTAFERLAVALLSALPSLPLSLHRRGGRADRGVDFFGTWKTRQADGSERLHRIIGQCKMERSIMGPIHLRALEGTVPQYHQDASEPTVGMLVSAQPYSLEAEAQWRRSTLPLVLVTIDPVAAIDIVSAIEGRAEAGVGEAGQGEATLTSHAGELLPCLRRFSLNPTAAALFPLVRVKTIKSGIHPPYITVLQDT